MDGAVHTVDTVGLHYVPILTTRGAPGNNLEGERVAVVQPYSAAYAGHDDAVRCCAAAFRKPVCSLCLNGHHWFTASPKSDSRLNTIHHKFSLGHVEFERS